MAATNADAIITSTRRLFKLPERAASALNSFHAYELRQKLNPSLETQVRSETSIFDNIFCAKRRQVTA